MAQLSIQRNLVSDLAIVESILRDRSNFFKEIRDEMDLQKKIYSMLMSSFVFLAFYGAVMGGRSGGAQMFSASIKLPLLFLVTLVICTPSLYFFNLLFGSKQTLPQNIALILTAMTTTSVLLLSLAPISLFFLLTTTEYSFFKLLNVGIFAISGAMGVVFLKQGFQMSIDVGNENGATARKIVFILWVGLYAFVGSQMAWTLSPFMGAPGEPFMVVHQIGGNFYSDVLQSLQELLTVY